MGLSRYAPTKPTLLNANPNGQRDGPVAPAEPRATQHRITSAVIGHYIERKGHSQIPMARVLVRAKPGSAARVAAFLAPETAQFRDLCGSRKAKPE